MSIPAGTPRLSHILVTSSWPGSSRRRGFQLISLEELVFKGWILAAGDDWVTLVAFGVGIDAVPGKYQWLSGLVQTKENALFKRGTVLMTEALKDFFK